MDVHYSRSANLLPKRPQVLKLVAPATTFTPDKRARAKPIRIEPLWSLSLFLLSSLFFATLAFLHSVFALFSARQKVAAS